MASPLSSPASFHTAQGDIDNRGNDRSSAATGVYHPVQPLPYELKDHVRVFLEERMYSEAIQLLTSLLAAGGSERQDNSSSSSLPPVWIPPPSHLAVLSTLMVHPAYTSRLQDGTDRRVAGHALQYLRHVLAVAGPVHGGFRTAFAFRDARGTSRGMSRSASGSRVQSQSNSRSRPRRLRAPAAHSALHGDSAYVDITTVVGSSQGGVEGGGGGGEGREAGQAMRDDEFDRMGDVDYDADDNDNDDNNNDDDDAVGARMATRDSVWTRGQDAWRVAGWALSCSVREPARWRAWRPWLGLLVEVLEADLAAALTAPGAGSGSSSGLRSTLLFAYLQGHSSHNHLRRLAAAVLADGSQPALLRAVFDKETAVLGTAKTAAAAAAASSSSIRLFDLDNNRFGDYSDDDESPPSSLPSSPLGTRNGAETDTSQDESIEGSGNRPGFLESLPLRRRLFYLIVLASLAFPEDFVAVDVVLRTFADVLREADVSVFSSFLLQPPAPSSLLCAPPLAASLVASPDDALVGLLRHVLFFYMPSSAPKPRSVDPAADRRLGVSLSVVERCFLPFAANTAALGANVRMALAVESLFRVVGAVAAAAGEPVWSPGLQTAVEAGVRAREGRARPLKRNAAVEAYGRDLLQRSGKRLLTMAMLAKMDA